MQAERNRQEVMEDSPRLFNCQPSIGLRGDALAQLPLLRSYRLQGGVA